MLDCYIDGSRRSFLPNYSELRESTRVYIDLHRHRHFLIEADLVRGLQAYAAYIDLCRVSGLSRWTEKMVHSTQNHALVSL
jgi:hypothetical protein